MGEKTRNFHPKSLTVIPYLCFNAIAQKIITIISILKQYNYDTKPHFTYLPKIAQSFLFVIFTTMH